MYHSILLITMDLLPLDVFSQLPWTSSRVPGHIVPVSSGTETGLGQRYDSFQ